MIGVTACGSDDEKTDKTYVAAMEATFPPFDIQKEGVKEGLPALILFQSRTHNRYHWQ